MKNILASTFWSNYPKANETWGLGLESRIERSDHNNNKNDNNHNLLYKGTMGGVCVCVFMYVCVGALCDTQFLSVPGGTLLSIYDKTLICYINTEIRSVQKLL